MAIGTTAAVLASAAIGAGTSLVASNQASKATQQGVQASTAANNAAIAESRRATDQAFGLQTRAYNDQLALNQPSWSFGTQALGQLAQAYGFTLPNVAYPGQQGAQGQPGQAGGQPFDQWGQYLQSNPDVAAEWSRPEVQQQFGGDPNAYAQHHYQTHGQAEGRQLPTAPAAQGQTAPVGQGAASAPPPGSPAAIIAGGPIRAERNPVNGANFQASPDYQFRRGEALSAVSGNASAQGLLESGAHTAGLLERAGNLASAEYGNWYERENRAYSDYYNREKGTYDDAYNRLASAAGLAQTVGQQVGQAGQNYAQNAGGLLQNNANQVGGFLQKSGQTAAQGYMQQGQIAGQTIGNLGGIGVGLLQGLGQPQYQAPVTQPWSQVSPYAQTVLNPSSVPQTTPLPYLPSLG